MFRFILYNIYKFIIILSYYISLYFDNIPFKQTNKQKNENENAYFTQQNDDEAEKI